MAKKKADQLPSLDRVRNVGIAAHIDAGKTTLTERILFYAGASHKIGEVHNGAAHMDFMQEEQAHGITITAAVTKCPWEDHLIQIVDTPGHVDFTIEVERAMRVLDGAVIVIDAVRGVEPQTETVWRQASRFDIPRLVFVNKMDRPGASYDRAMQTISKRLGGHPVPVCVPIEGDIVLDLVRQVAYSFKGALGEDVQEQAIPAQDMDTFARHRETMLLACAEFDPELEDAVLMGEEISEDRVWAALRKGCMTGRAHPVFGGSALRNWGVQPLMSGAVKLLPAPLERPPAIAHDTSGNEELVEMDATGPLVALAFKVQLFEGRRHVFLRVYRGQINAGDAVATASGDKPERVARLFDVDASRKTRVESAYAGQIVLAAGLRHATTGDTLCTPEHIVSLERIDARAPVLGLAIEPTSSSEEAKLFEVIGKICEEDPTVRFSEDAETGQRILEGMGELHLQIIFERIEREFGLTVRVGKPRVNIRETIRGPGQSDILVDRCFRMGEDREINLKAGAAAAVTPLPRNTGITLKVEPVTLPAGQSLSAAQRDAVEAGVRDATMSGPAEGAELQDVAVRLLSVTLFDQASSPQALRMAASQAVRDALVAAGSSVLRPLMAIEVVVPDENLGGVLGDLQARGAIILGQENELGTSTLQGECPLEALLGYATELRSLTRGRGQFTMEFNRFDALN